MSSSQNQVLLYQLAYQLSQEKLSSQADAAIGADSRAMSFSGLSLTTGALLIGLAKESFIPIAALAGGGVLIAAASIAAYSARPIDFRFPGANFNDLSSDISKNVDLIIVLDELGKFTEKHIQENNKILAENANTLKQSIYFAIFGMIVALVPQLLSAMN